MCWEHLTHEVDQFVDWSNDIEAMNMKVTTDMQHETSHRVRASWPLSRPIRRLINDMEAVGMT
jgi:hypothetical protein